MKKAGCRSKHDDISDEPDQRAIEINRVFMRIVSENKERWQCPLAQMIDRHRQQKERGRQPRASPEKFAKATNPANWISAMIIVSAHTIG